MGAEECQVVVLGEHGQASIAQYIGSSNSLDQMLHRMKATANLLENIKASCTLTNYLDLKLAGKHLEIPAALLTPIVDFHGGISLHALNHMDADAIEALAAQLDALNHNLAEGAYEIYEAAPWPS